MKKTYLFLAVNLGLWFYTLHALFVALSAPATPLDNQLKQFFESITTWLKTQWYHVSHFIFDWQTLVILLILVGIVLAVWKVWKATFLVLAIVTILVVVWMVYYVVKAQNMSANYFSLVVLAITLGNIWLAAKASNL